MATPAQVVEEQFSQSRTTANTYVAEAKTFTEAFTNALFPAALVDVTFAPVAAPTPLNVPARPAAMDAIDTELVWDATIAASKPGDLVAAAPDLVIDEFTEVAPTLDFGAAPVLDFGIAPVLDFGVRPTVDPIADVPIPAAPIIGAVALPTLLTLTTPTFAGIDLHAAYLSNLETIPTLALAQPTPFSYSPGPAYASDLLTTLKATMIQRLAGGTGLAPADEAAIWDRARSRETQLGIAGEAEVTRTHEALGYQLPSGALAAQLRAAQIDTLNKSSTLSRDVALKQADLAQENMKQTIAAGMDLERTLITNALELEKLSFEAAKEVAENAIAVHNALVTKFKESVLGAYELYRGAYDTIIKGELAKVDVFKALIAAEQSKADVNRSLIEQYKAQIEAGLSLVKIYEAEVGGAKARMDLEQAKLAAQGEQIRAYVAGINGETARLEAHKVNAEIQGIKANVYKIGVDAQVSKVEVFKAHTSAYQAKVGAQAERSRAQVSYYNGLVSAYTAKWSGWEARVKGESARFQALASKYGVLLDGYKAELAGVEAQSNQDIKRWDTQIREYEALQTYTFQATKANNDVLQARGQMVLDATKAGAQIFAQLASSALSTAHVSAGVSGSSSMTVGYSYGNDTTGAAPTVTSV